MSRLRDCRCATPRTKPPLAALPKLIVGCRLVLEDCAVEWLVLPRDLAAYKRLTRLLTLGKRRAAKGDCTLYTKDMIAGCRRCATMCGVMPKVAAISSASRPCFTSLAKALY